VTGGGVGPAVRALGYWERRQEVAANNLANVSTPGFKGQRVFATLLVDGGPAAQVQDDLAAGGVTQTGRPLDVALETEGFLVVETPQGERYQRGGSFHLDETGAVVNEHGHPLLGTDGAIVVPPGEIVIRRDGTIEVGGERVARLRVDSPSQAPRRDGENLWLPVGPGQRLDESAVRVRQGHLEESNVEPVTAMVDMIGIQRAYQALQRTIQTQDGVLHTITSEIGRVDG